MEIIASKLVLKSNPKIFVVASTFNKPIVDELVNGAVEAFTKHNLTNITIVYAPGAYELPFVSKLVIEKTKDLAGLVAIGALIKGETSHFDHIASQCSSNLANLSLESMTPITFGVLTTENVDQALARTGIKTSNKGCEAALALIELLSLKEQL